MNKIAYQNIIVLILITFSELFNFIFNQGASPHKHYFILVEYRFSFDDRAMMFDFTYLLILIGILINVRYLSKHRK